MINNLRNNDSPTYIAAFHYINDQQYPHSDLFHTITDHVCIKTTHKM